MRRVICFLCEKGRRGFLKHIGKKPLDGLSDRTEMFSFVLGGCGKMEQYPLPVGFGGPYVSVSKMTVQ